MMKVGILTVSDRSARGEREDLSGSALARAVVERWPSASGGAGNSLAAVVVETATVPDEQEQISALLIRWSDELGLALILTTGGTGFAPRDVTPEATRAVIHREAPGMAEVMRAESFRITQHAMLSRGVVGMRGRTLIVNLPGSPKGAVENLNTILPMLPHALELLAEAPDAEQHH